MKIEELEKSKKYDWEILVSEMTEDSLDSFHYHGTVAEAKRAIKAFGLEIAKASVQTCEPAEKISVEQNGTAVFVQFHFFHCQIRMALASETKELNIHGWSAKLADTIGAEVEDEGELKELLIRPVWKVGYFDGHTMQYCETDVMADDEAQAWEQIVDPIRNFENKLIGVTRVSEE